jgi:pimeloyl-ACP methyl ester carboxylesterase
VAALSPSFTVITVDLRGFGNTRWESDHDARNFPGDIIAVLDAVAAGGGPDRAAGVILAHSLGGLRDDELTALVAADRLMTPEFRLQRVVPDAPHSMYWEGPDLFNDAVARFLKEVASA